MRQVLTRNGIIIVAAVVVAAVMLRLQSRHTGFWLTGHGWSSVHVMAQWEHATPENGFVAYSLGWRLADGSLDYEYFDRYPVFLSAAMHGLITQIDNLSLEIYAFRQIMNVIMLLMMAAAYKVVRLFVVSRPLAAGITIFSFSSYPLLFYKDMMHFDQAAMVMMLVLIYAIARWRQGQLRLAWLVAVALVAVSIGRGYASFFVLGLWAAFSALERVLTGDDSLPARLAGVVRHPSVWITVGAVTWATAMLGYNVLMEARIRDVPVAQTSIVDSALRRLPGVGYAVDDSSRYNNEANQGLGAWGGFTLVQTERLARWALPARLGGEMPWRYQYVNDPLNVTPWRLGIGMLLFVLAGVHITRTRPPLRIPAALTAFSGVVWMFFMINLTAEHDFITTYGVGLTLTAYTAALGWLARVRGAGVAVLLVSLAAFTLGNWQVRQDVQAIEPQNQAYTQDFMRMRAELPATGDTVYLDTDYHRRECVIRDWQCYALGYYLPADFYLTETFSVADMVLSPRPFYAPDPFVTPGEPTDWVKQTLTPGNQRLHLLDRADMTTQPAPTPDAITARYGGNLRLQQVAVNGDVTLSACEHVTIESWWLAEQSLDVNYNVQAVMVSADGRAITEANAPLGSVPASIWEVGQSTPDARTLVVPCDTPPGEYPLILGVYNPDTLEPLPVTDADGNALGNQMYLTTLFVE